MKHSNVQFHMKEVFLLKANADVLKCPFPIKKLVTSPPPPNKLILLDKRKHFFMEKSE